MIASGTQTRRLLINGIIWGDANVNKHDGSEVECFSGIKTSQTSKTEGGIERKKHENVKLMQEQQTTTLSELEL